MKKFAVLMLSFICAVTLHAQTDPATDAGGGDISKVIEFKEMDHDFGKIPYGKPATFDLVMKNISNDSVTLDRVQAGCGCTTPNLTDGNGPFAPGQSFKVNIGFNGYTEGQFNKIVTVYLKGGLSQVIKFHGETFKAPDNAAPGNKAVQQLNSGGN